MRGRCSASPTRSAAAAWPSRTPSTSSEFERFEFDLAHGDAPAAGSARRDRRPARPLRRRLRSPDAYNDWPASYSWLEVLRRCRSAGRAGRRRTHRRTAQTRRRVEQPAARRVRLAARDGDRSCLATTLRRASMTISTSKRRAGRLVASIVLAATAAGTAGDRADAGSDESFTLRVAMGSPGEAQIAVWEAAGAAFEEAHPGVTVEFNFQDDDLYQTIGLPNLLSSGNPPDVYFEWAGARLEARRAGLRPRPLQRSRRDRARRAVRRERLQQHDRRRPDRDGPRQRRRHQRHLVQRRPLRRARPRPAGDVGRVPRPLPDDRRRGLFPLSIGNLDLWAGGNRQPCRVAGHRCRRTAR